VASAKQLKAAMAVRMLVLGHPGSGKTGSLAALANAGFKLRIIDLDGNPEPLLQYVDEDKLDNIDIVTLEDQITDDGEYAGPKGVPSAFTRAMRLLDRWRYLDPEGEAELDKATNAPKVDKAGNVIRWRDLGRPADWGPDTILVTDGMTGVGAAAFRRARVNLNKTPLNTTRSVWTLAINDLQSYVNRVTDGTLKCHSIMLSHLKLIGPKGEEGDDSTLTKSIKAAAAEHIPTRYYPSALGRDYAGNVSGDFPNVIRAEVKRGKRLLTWKPTEEVDLKLPGKRVDALGELTIDDGLLKIFRALGAEPPTA